MTLTADEFDSFAEFGRARLGHGPQDLTLDDLVIEWESSRNRDEIINAAIREGLADAVAGRHRPAAEAMAELRKKHNLPPQSLSSTHNSLS